MARLLLGIVLGLSFLTVSPKAQAYIYLSYATNTVSIPAGQSRGVSATCPDGTILLGGGWEDMDTANRDTFVFASRPYGSAWGISAKNTGSSSVSVSAWAVCASGDIGSASTYQATAYINVPSYSSGCGVATCTGGGNPQAVAGGFWGALDENTLVPQGTYPGISYSNTWTVCGYNPTNSAKSITAYAQCVTDLPTSFYWNQGSGIGIAPMGSGTAVATCGLNEAIGGGFFNATYSNDLRMVRTTQNRPGYKRWNVTIANGRSEWATTSAWVQCMRQN